MSYVLVETDSQKKLWVVSASDDSNAQKLNHTLEGMSLHGLEAFCQSEQVTAFGFKNEAGRQWYLLTPSGYETAYNGFFYKIVESSHDEIYVCDGEGRTLYCNKTFEKNYGLSPKEMIGKTAMDLVTGGYSNQTPVPEVIRTKAAFTLPQETATGKRLMITATPYLTPEGSIDFIVENCRDTTELEAMRQVLEAKTSEAERYKLEAQSLLQLSDASSESADVALSHTMRQLNEKARRIAPTDASVLILGETGTGKSHMAQFLHRHSHRNDRPFISVNCAALSPTLFESELFGYASGAFTGALPRGRQGLAALAEGGTLFFDEIGDLSLALQVKLLELIQDKRYCPVGSSVYQQADLRIVVATNRDLRSLVDQGLFREDLFYRLKVIELLMPPLRERKEDLSVFLDSFLAKFNRIYGLHKQFSPETRSILMAYNWPGNIRETQNLIHNLVLMSKELLIDPADLPSTLVLESTHGESAEMLGDWDHLMESYERHIIQKAYKQAESSYKLANLLGISQSKASRLIRKYI